ncbi:phosphotransferase family protein [Nocardioides speluncae]|uniref:phosphotransferase family protein n=1 Tax=Nocardioides speluncae TaxID=2670337 RepID=UPI000D6952AB|nr:phosphotransferase family protein [Nocardioides speluncae]
MTDLTPEKLAGIADAMALEGAPPARELGATVLSGGRSNLTYVITDGQKRWVLRTPPRTGRTPSAHDVVREHRVTSALAGTPVPVAEAILLHEDDDLLGVPFTVSGFVDGATLRTQADLVPLDDATLAVVVDRMIAALVALHDVDHAAVGLEEFGRPDRYAARQARRWKSQWEIVGPPELEGLANEVVCVLERDLPSQRRTSIVHGDYRIDNTIIAGSGTATRVAAVVDWELSTIGDPVADVAMMCAYREPAFDLIMGAPSAWTSNRLPEPDSLAEQYAVASGHDLEHWSFHRALACFKVAVIAAGIDHRRRAGSGSGAGFDTAGESVPQFLEIAHQIAARS